MIVLLVALEILFWVSGVRRFSPFKTISLFGFYNNQEVVEPATLHRLVEVVVQQKRRDEVRPSVLQQFADYPGDGGNERVAMSDAGESKLHDPGEFEAEGGKVTRILLPGSVCGDGCF